MPRPKRVLSFEFSGGDADENQLNFYDASRFMYGASRFIYTLEHFRQKGVVVSRITERVNVDYRIGPSRRGSWIQDIILVAGPPLAQLLVQVPIDVLIAWVTHKLIDTKGSRETVAQLEKERTAQERERTRQERERTRQSLEETKRLEIATQSNRAALDLANKSMEHIARFDVENRSRLKDAQAKLEAAVNREEVLDKYSKPLSNITRKQEKKLLERAQSQLAEVGKPLITSAGVLKIKGRSFVGSIAYLNRTSVTELTGDLEDDVPIPLAGSITRYDKETGWGKFRNAQFVRPIPFVVPGAKKGRIRDEIIDAMKGETVELSFYFVRSRLGNPKYLVVDRIIHD